MDAQTLNTTGDPVAEPEGHAQEMIDKVDEKTAELEKIGKPEEQSQEEPELILGKFKSQSDLEAAYKELERKLSQGNQEEASNDGKEEGSKEPEVDPESATKEEVNEVVEKAGLNMEEITNAYQQNGVLSNEHYEALEKVGITRDIVDQYIAGQEAQALQYRNEILEEIGGEKTFEAMADWATQNLTKEELDAYNAAVDSGDMSRARNAVTSLAYRFEKAGGREPELIHGDANGGTSGGFESLAQLTEAMKDPRYSKDPAYRAEVEAKLKNSSIL